MTVRWPSRIAAFSLWALAALSAMYWMLKVGGVAEAPVTVGAISVETPTVDVLGLARALGPDAPAGATTTMAAAPQLQTPQDPAARMRLLGVVAGRRSGGVALISIDGQLPRPYRVGSQVDTHYTLTRVATRSATLSPTKPQGQAFTLELPMTTPEVPPRPAPWGGSAASGLPGSARVHPEPGAPIVAPAANATVIAPAPATGDQPKQ